MDLMIWNSQQETATEANIPKSSSFINAFQLIAMSHDLNLSGLFEEKASQKVRTSVIILKTASFAFLIEVFFFQTIQDENKQVTRLGSKHTIHETMKKIEAAAMDVSLAVERMKNHKVQSPYTLILQPKQHPTKTRNTFFLGHLWLLCTKTDKDASKTEDD